MADYSDFGELLGKYLNDKDQTQTWLARRLGVTPATVSRWLNNISNRPENPETVIRIAGFLGLNQREQYEGLLKAAGYPPSLEYHREMLSAGSTEKANQAVKFIALVLGESNEVPSRSDEGNTSVSLTPDLQALVQESVAQALAESTSKVQVTFIRLKDAAADFPFEIYCDDKFITRVRRESAAYFFVEPGTHSLYVTFFHSYTTKGHIKYGGGTQYFSGKSPTVSLNFKSGESYFFECGVQKSRIPLVDWYHTLMSSWPLYIKAKKAG